MSIRTVDAHYEIEVSGQTNTNAAEPDTIYPDTVILDIKSAQDNGFLLSLEVSQDSIRKLSYELLEQLKS